MSQVTCGKCGDQYPNDSSVGCYRCFAKVPVGPAPPPAAPPAPLIMCGKCATWYASASPIGCPVCHPHFAVAPGLKASIAPAPPDPPADGPNTAATLAAGELRIDLAPPAPRCDCGGDKMKLPHAMWCSTRGERRG